ncbi:MULTISPECIES: antibiotic biosynthesis monooxygenase [unclassified Marinobacterium]|jgi:antibiotic biosynthesis monooxygenase (ABM) superfamily enzyme|uniref:antibiotic biosynthesis monooxygenase n=1 Tax=unclassified Marinobacterium TaxID=2644139 RepID=UPI001568F669|nr:hypothetical protein [Marinobacterium sp. xm-d-543]NRQ01312.1 hypothetical protein [Marinobacterium sp. xm-d-530]
MTSEKPLTAEHTANGSTSYLVSLRVCYENEYHLSDQLTRIIPKLKSTPGFESIDVIRRKGGQGVDFYLLTRFKSLKALESWKNSPQRIEALRPIEEMSITDISREHASGSNIWFEPVTCLPSQPLPPLHWKRWVLSILAVYPLLFLLINLLRPITSQLPEAIGLFLIVSILTGLTTFYIVPWLSKRLITWLSRR